MNDIEHSQIGIVDEDKPSDPMLDHVNAIAQLHARAESRLSRPQRIIEQATSSLGRPVTIWFILGFIGLWAAINLAGPRLGIHAWDRWPFGTLQLIAGLVSLIIATMILITENRQSKMDERRGQLDLQISLVTEQKITKLIALVEELRRDMPNVHDRTDLEAEAMQQPADPHAVSSALEYAMEEGSDGSASEYLSGQPTDASETSQS